MIALLLLAACGGDPARYPAVADALLARADLDGDGRVDAAEYALLARPDEPLGTCDTDGDRALGRAELEACFLSVSPTRLQAERRRVWMEARGEGPRGEGPRGEGPRGKARAPR